MGNRAGSKIVPIWDADLSPNAHRLLWWLLAHQVKHKGVPTGTVAEGWREKAENEMHMTRKGLWEATTRLQKAGIILREKRQKNLRIDGRAFEHGQRIETNPVGASTFSKGRGDSIFGLLDLDGVRGQSRLRRNRY